MHNFTYYPTPQHPFREALQAVVGKVPPAYVKGFGTEGLTDKQVSDLQDWCSLNARPEWATGLSMIEAAELIVRGAIENGNIDKVFPSDRMPSRGFSKRVKKVAKKTVKRVAPQHSSRGTRIDGSTRIGE
jgi:hypothetical protein